MAAGGKGANQAVATARLGAEVTLVARLGSDPLGDEAIVGYEHDAILTDLIVRDPDRPTGVALILVDAHGENSIIVALGANEALSPADGDRVAGFRGGRSGDHRGGPQSPPAGQSGAAGLRTPPVWRPSIDRRRPAEL